MVYYLEKTRVEDLRVQEVNLEVNWQYGQSAAP